MRADMLGIPRDTFIPKDKKEYPTGWGYTMMRGCIKSLKL